MNDRDVHRRGARARRPLTGKLDYIRALLENVQTEIAEASRDADSQAHSRWVHAELGHLCADVTRATERARELHGDMMQKGLSPHALAAPLPLVLKRPDPPFMAIEASLASDGRSA